MGIFAIFFMILMMVIIVFLVIGGLLFILALFGVPKLFDFIKLFHQGEEKKAYKKLLYSFLFVLPFLLFVLFFLGKYGLFYQSMAGIFLVSSYFGLAVFILFLYSVKKQHIKNSIKSLFMGGVIFIFFAPSGFFTLKPIVTYLIEHPDVSSIDLLDIILPTSDNNSSLIDDLFSNTPVEDYDSCHDKEDWLAGGFCTSREITIQSILGRWELDKNYMDFDYKNDEKYKKSYFVLNSNGTVFFHAYSVVRAESYYMDDIKYMDFNGTWKLFQEHENFHPYITISSKTNKLITFYFTSYTTKEEALALVDRYSDPDAPKDLRFIRKSVISK